MPAWARIPTALIAIIKLTSEDLVCIVTEAPLPVPEELGPELRDLVDACLAKDPADRPPSAAVLVDALRSARLALTPAR